jgi:multidrug efflux pump subunit AcrB
MRGRYRSGLEWTLHHRAFFATVFLAFCVGTFALVPFLGRDFFPAVDAGQFRLHVRAKTGTRIEAMAGLCDRIEASIRGVIPASEMGAVIDNIGLPYSGINTSYANNGTIGTADAEILVSLKEGHRPTAGYVKRMREELPREFPGVAFFFQPADIVTQILNFGLPSPIDIQIVGRDQRDDYKVATALLGDIDRIPGVADTHIQQVFDQPQLSVAIDRTKARELGLALSDVTGNLLTALSGSGQTTPTYWLNPENGVNYSLVSQMPDYTVDSLQTLENIPVVNAARTGTPQVLGNLATFHLTSGAGIVTHYNVTPTIDVYATTQGRDLGGVASDIEKVVRKYEPRLPRGSSVVMRGQVETMRESFRGLGIGILGAVVLVYLLIVVNFQSWTDPFIIITALPGALAGIVWMLFVTGTTMNVPSLMGSIMCVGVATANSILIISFAKEQYDRTGNALASAVDAGTTRLRPVLMTALAMIIGMLPMAFGFGEGGEQNAPLARAVIGGLLFATVATLYFVPVIFTLIRHPRSRT